MRRGLGVIFFVVFGILGYPDAFFFLNPYVPIHVFRLLSCFDPNFIHCIFFKGFQELQLNEQTAAYHVILSAFLGNPGISSDSCVCHKVVIFFQNHVRLFIAFKVYETVKAPTINCSFCLLCIFLICVDIHSA